MVNRSKDLEKSGQEEKKKSSTYWERMILAYWERVIHGKGTVSEPWPTAKELWNDPEVQKSIQTHNQSVKKVNGS